MRLIAWLLVLGVAVGSSAEQSVDENYIGFGQQDTLFERTGLFLHDIPPEAPEDKLYPTSENLYKLEDFHRLHDIYLEAMDLPRFERAFRLWGSSDGIFNVPEGISRADEWDVGGYRVACRSETGEFVPLSKEEIAQNRFEARPYASISSFRYVTSLGHLAKQCDGVFIGEVSKVGFRSPEERSGIAQHHVHEVRLTFRVNTNLFGYISKNTGTIPIMWEEEFFPVKGIKLLCFYANGYTINL